MLKPHKSFKYSCVFLIVLFLVIFFISPWLRSLTYRNLVLSAPKLKINFQDKSLECFKVDLDDASIYEKISFNKSILNINSKIPDIQNIPKDNVIKLNFGNYKPDIVKISYILLSKEGKKLLAYGEKINVSVFNDNDRFAFKFQENSSSNLNKNAFCRVYFINVFFGNKNYIYAFYAKDIINAKSFLSNISIEDGNR